MLPTKNESNKEKLFKINLDFVTGAVLTSVGGRVRKIKLKIYIDLIVEAPSSSFSKWNVNSLNAHFS